MKICVISDDFPPRVKGGAGVVAFDLARALTGHGHDVFVITTVQDRALAGTFNEEGIQIARLYSPDYPQRWRSWRSLYNPTTVPVVQRLFEEVRPDIVHAHNVHYYLSYWTLRIARTSGARVFLTVHDVMLFHYGKLTSFVDQSNPVCRSSWDYRVRPWQQWRQYRFWYNPFRNILIKILLRNVSRIFAVSGAVKEALAQNGISNAEVLLNAIDVEKWIVEGEAVEAFKQKHALEGKSVILFGGRITGLKGGNVMLAALREIIKGNPRTVLALLGTRDAYVQSLERQAKEWGIAPHVVSLGWVAGDERVAAYHAATLVVVPSLCFDSCPLVVLEAMACRKPVVGSCFGGIPEMIVDGVTGYVVHPHDQATLVGRITTLLNDQELRNRFGEAGWSRAKNDFSPESWYEHTYATYSNYF